MILGLSSSYKFAKNLSTKWGEDFYQCVVTHFNNSELKTTLDVEKIRGNSPTLIQSLSNPVNDSLMELYFSLSTLSRYGIESKNLIIPYLGYSRQEKEHLTGESESLKTVLEMCKTLGVESITTFDIHNPSCTANMPIKINNIESTGFLAEKIKLVFDMRGIEEEDVMVVSPDMGGVDRCQKFADNFYEETQPAIVTAEKKRDLTKTHTCKITNINGEISRKNAIIVDDVSTSGGTILNVIDILLQNNVENIYILVVHADFSKDVAFKLAQNNAVKNIFTSNTIENTVDDLSEIDKFKIIDITSLIKKRDSQAEFVTIKSKELSMATNI